MAYFIGACIALIGLPLLFTAWLLNAPTGYQDDHGYHAGTRE